MQILRFGGSRGILTIVVLALMAAPAAAQCQLDGCTTSCAGGCGASSFPVLHSTLGFGGSTAVFDLTATDYGPADGDTDCDSGAEAPCDNIGSIPPLRFWAYDDYVNANSGCALTTRVGQSWIVNCVFDQPGCGGIGTDGYWTLSQSNWATPAIPGPDTGDGCIAASPNARTVVEMSWGDTLSGEGTVDHDAWYVVAAVDFAGAYDFDRITGGLLANGVGDGTLAAQSVPNVSLGATCPVLGMTFLGQPNALEPLSYFDVPLTIDDTSPPYLTEAGANPPGTPLIAGIQIVYQQSANPPTSGDPSLWLPALDPSNPLQNAPLVGWGGSNSATVSLPNAGFGGDPYWLGARLVYVDSTINAGLDPRLTSWVGGSCGPALEDMGMAVVYDDVSALQTANGVLVRWSTLLEDDTLGFQVYRTSDPAGTESSVVVGSTESVGAYMPYSVIDDSVVGPQKTTWYYYVQEITSSGPGDRSEVVPALRIEDATGGSGGRERTTSLR